MDILPSTPTRRRRPAAHRVGTPDLVAEVARPVVVLWFTGVVGYLGWLLATAP